MDHRAVKPSGIKELSPVFESVILKGLNWSVGDFYRAIGRLKENGIEVSFWDSEENWASILANNVVVGYVWRRYPLVIAVKSVMSSIRRSLNELDMISYIEVEDLSRDLFMISDLELRLHLENAVDFDSFTIEDLWFNTNSR